MDSRALANSRECGEMTCQRARWSRVTWCPLRKRRDALCYRDHSHAHHHLIRQRSNGDETCLASCACSALSLRSPHGFGRKADEVAQLSHLVRTEVMIGAGAPSSGRGHTPRSRASRTTCIWRGSGCGRHAENAGSRPCYFVTDYGGARHLLSSKSGRDRTQTAQRCGVPAGHARS